jgi:hypothetical protein
MSSDWLSASIVRWLCANGQTLTPKSRVYVSDVTGADQMALTWPTGVLVEDHRTWRRYLFGSGSAQRRG